MSVPHTLTARPHRPLPPDVVAELRDAAVMRRAAALVDIDIDELPITFSPHHGGERLAATRTAAELLLARLELLLPCPDCAGTDQRLDCAQELGTLEARLAAAAARAQFALASLLRHPDLYAA
ncbi:hypothetical protein [Geodermatophilus sp. FMUSA9-8]|uniref:hypothetical protein n=1 Tax=Geodermatophilus sp. FMUSA9-8 TaxID=3120155 RepID=UPI00300BEFEE